MGIIGDIAEHLGTNVVTGLGLTKEQKKERGKWGALFAVVAMIILLISFLRKQSLKNADLLGGKETIEKFLHTNVTCMALVLAMALAMIVICFKTWKGRASSIYQLIFVGACWLLILYSGITTMIAVHNISRELDGPKTVNMKQYVLCMRGSDYILAFDEEGSKDGVVLVIPKEKYDELSAGEVSTETYLSRTMRLIQESEYVEYKNAKLYASPIEISYYPDSIIYESCAFDREAGAQAAQNGQSDLS